MLHAFTHLYQVALMPLYLLIQKDFHFRSVGEATLLLTVMMASSFAPSYPIGILADKMSRKKLLGFGLALNGLGFAALSLAPNYPCALLAVIVAGFGGSFYHPAATAMIARLFPRTTGKALGLVGIGAGTGFFIGPLYSGWRADGLAAALGPAAWRRPVLELGLLGILAAALFAWLGDDHEEPAPVAEHKPARPGQMFPTAALWVFFLGYCLAFSLRDFTGAGMASLGSLFLQQARGYDPKRTGLALSVIFLAATVSNPIFGSLSDRGRKRWIMLALSVAAMMVAIFPHAPENWTLPALAIYGFFFMAAYPMTEAALMESVPDAVRGRVFGIFMTAGGVIGNFAHWIIGAWVKRLGPAALSPSGYYPIYFGLGLLLLCSLSGLLCLHAIQRRERFVGTVTPPKDRVPLESLQ